MRNRKTRGVETSPPHITPPWKFSAGPTGHRWFTLWDAITSVTFPFNWVTSDSLFEAKVIFFHKSKSPHSPYLKGGGVTDGFADVGSHGSGGGGGADGDIYMLLTCSLICWIFKKNTWKVYFNVHTLRYTCQEKLHNWVCSKTTRCNLLHGAFQIFVLMASESSRVASSVSFTATQRGSCHFAT